MTDPQFPATPADSGEAHAVSAAPAAAPVPAQPATEALAAAAPADLPWEDGQSAPAASSQAPADAAGASASASVSPSEAEAEAEAEAGAEGGGRRGRRRGRRGGAKPQAAQQAGEAAADGAAAAEAGTPQSQQGAGRQQPQGRGKGQPGKGQQPKAEAGGKPAGPRPPREVHPLLHKLAELHPQLFGARFRPLKLGTYEELLARHPGVLEAEPLKVAIAQHARSTRYLESMAIGDRRHDLDGNAVDEVSADHRFHAIMEIHRRQQAREPGKDRRPQLLQRIVAAVRDSGLDREGYLAQIRTSDPAALALVHEAFDAVGAEVAKREALRRAFEASGQTPEAFAQMYGMSLAQVKQALKK